MMRAWWMVFLASLFYGYEFMIRISSGVLVDPLSAYFGVGLGEIGLLSAAFFFTYIPMQIPAGHWVDRFGPKRTLVCASGLCGLSMLLFGHTPYFWVATLSRACIGFASAFSYLAALILVKRYISSKYFTLCVGLVQVMGCLGGVLGGYPIGYATQLWGFQLALTYVGLVGLVLSMGFGIFLEKDDRSCHLESLRLGLKGVLSNPLAWKVGFLAFCFWVPMSIFAELWGGKFLSLVTHHTLVEASKLMVWVWVGVMFGGVFWGIFTQYVEAYWSMMVGLLMSLVSLLWVIYVQGPGSIFFLFFLGVGCAAQAVTFMKVKDFTPEAYLGLGFAFNNMATIVGAGFLQPLVGFWVDHVVGKGMVWGFESAFLLMPILIGCGLVVAWTLRSDDRDF